MSGQSLVMFISLVAIAMAANRAEDSSSWLQQNHRDQNPGVSAHRGLASMNRKKDIEFTRKDAMKHTQKVRGPLAAVVELVGQRPVQPGDVFVLRGVVSAESPLENVEFSWRVPAGVEIVNGQISSVIAALSAGKPFETQITLRQVSPSDERVVLRVHGRDSDMRFGDSAVYHTMEQQNLEAARLELKATAEEYMKGNPGTKQIETFAPAQKQLKIFH